MAEYISLAMVRDEDVAALRNSGEFDEAWYLAEYPDVRKSGIDPARHYLWLGRRLGRKPSARAAATEAGIRAVTRPSIGTVAVAEPNGPMPAGTGQKSATDETEVGLIDHVRRMFTPRRSPTGDAVYNLVAEHLDEDFYLTTYPDVAAAGVDPVQHYLDAGWREGRDPSLSFSTRFYLENNPDVGAAGVNPFYHFIAAGKAEGRQGKHQLGFRWDILSRLKPVAEQISETKAYRSPPTRTPISAIEGDLRAGLTGARKLVLSFSHDDFTRNVGGVQLLLRRELRLFRARGDAHVHLFPEHPLAFLDTSGEEISLGVLVNGKLAGFGPARDIAAILARVRPAALETVFAVHSLLGHNMDQTIDLLERCAAGEGVVWLHDYSLIYNNFKLLRNDVEYCGFPRPGTLARELCEFARADFCQAREFGKLFDRFRPKVVSPSQTALDIFNDAGVLQPRSGHVVEHVRLVEEARQSVAESRREGPLRIGFLGYPANHKGWAVFQDLVLRFGDDPRYQFYHLGKGRVGGLNARFIEVSGSETNPDAMRQAVAQAQLDVALLWSIWPETFCLTAYEALAAGAFLVTNPDAGNVVAAIAETDQGLVLRDEAALQAALEAGDLDRYARSRRTVRHYRMQYSNLSVEVLD